MAKRQQKETRKEIIFDLESHSYLEALTTYQGIGLKALLGVMDETAQYRWRS